MPNRLRASATPHGRWRAAALSVVLLGLMLAGCGGSKDKGGSQTAAKVNKEEITVHQINFVLQQQRGLRPDQAGVAGKQVLERLIDQELALQKAEELKLDRDPRVVQQIEAAKRDIVARAYVDKLGETAAKPTADEVQKYYDAKPALFKDRRIYSIQELNVEAKPEQIDGLRAKLAESKNMNEFVDFLKTSDFKFAANQAVRAAEQLPLAALDAFAKMKDGQAVLTPNATGAQVIVLAGSRSQPVDVDRARPAIEQFLLNERKRELVGKDIKALRDTAKIVYVGKFADAAASAAVPTAPDGSASGSDLTSVPATAQPTPTPPAAASEPAASGLDAANIKKGLGLK